MKARIIDVVAVITETPTKTTKKNKKVYLSLRRHDFSSCFTESCFKKDSLAVAESLMAIGLKCINIRKSQLNRAHTEKCLNLQKKSISEYI